MGDARVVIVEADLVQELVEEVRSLRAQVATLRPKDLPAWLSLKEAAELKGVSFEALRRQPKRYWPNFGHGGALSSDRRKRMYHRDDVLEWCRWDQDEIDRRYTAYLREQVRQKETARGNER